MHEHVKFLCRTACTVEQEFQLCAHEHTGQIITALLLKMPASTLTWEVMSRYVAGRVLMQKMAV